ncbi:GrpB family protein [Spirosoma sp. KCTC 42546]|uniref:GrpB family protein n=1 Tax=Spirosoma sp. KCTC 42546 TaxID=2520506 RepID=UPI00115B88E1|nr:GrpB family protein [Spirosoma sp. KCTC 42546]QDK79272.1 GrpB family protein [Spirosoma sp. KCTC 42546]
MLIQDYTADWLTDFNELKKVLHEALFDLTVSIEHVGSTSIPELAAKPIIDIDLVFSSRLEFHELTKRLRKIGYYHNGNQGIPNREVFKRDTITAKHPVLDFISHHLYACPTDSEELQKHILFRDYLSRNKEARIYYQTLKYEIADEAKQDRKKYAQLKERKASDFINHIIEIAKNTNAT